MNMIWTLLVIQAAVVQGGSHEAACMTEVGKLADPAAAPKAADGKACIPMSRRLAQTPRFPMPWRRLDAHGGEAGMEMVVNLCKDSTCKAFIKDLLTKCKDVAMMKEMIEPMSKMLGKDLAMCDDKCFMAIVDINVQKCKLGSGTDEGAKICEQTGACKTAACAVTTNCKCDKPMMGMAAAEWKKGCDQMMAKKECACPAAPSPASETDAAARTMASSVAMAFLLARFA
jgi:hypothetical protein